MWTTRFDFWLLVWVGNLVLIWICWHEIQKWQLGNQISVKKMHELSNLLAVGLLNLFHSLIMFTLMSLLPLFLFCVTEALALKWKYLIPGSLECCSSMFSNKKNNKVLLHFSGCSHFLGLVSPNWLMSEDYVGWGWWNNRLLEFYTDPTTWNELQSSRQKFCCIFINSARLHFPSFGRCLFWTTIAISVQFRKCPELCCFAWIPLNWVRKT